MCAALLVEHLDPVRGTFEVMIELWRAGAQQPLYADAPALPKGLRQRLAVEFGIELQRGYGGHEAALMCARWGCSTRTILPPSTWSTMSAQATSAGRCEMAMRVMGRLAMPRAIMPSVRSSRLAVPSSSTSTSGWR